MVVHQFALTVSALLAGVVSGVTFTAEFEKTLETQLAKIKQDLEAYPDLQPVVEGVPQDVAGWKALSLDETLTKLRLFSSQKADEMPFLYALDRENTAELTKFATDGHDLVMQITDFLASDSGEASLVPVEGTSSGAAPAPPASLPATGASATGASAAVPAAGAAVNGAATTTKTAISTTVSIPAAAGSATSTVSGSSSAVASPAAANVAAGGNTAAASAAVSVSVGDKSVQSTSSNVAANVLSLSTTGLFSDTNSTGSNSTDTASADDVGVDGNKSANPLPTPVSSASRSLLSVVAASAAAIVLTTVM